MEGHRYNGDYRRGAPEGNGVFETADGDIYQGQFRDGLPNGRGEFFYGKSKEREKSKDILEGEQTEHKGGNMKEE